MPNTRQNSPRRAGHPIRAFPANLRLDLVTPELKAIIEGNFDYAARQCTKLCLERTESRIARIRQVLARAHTYSEIANEFNILLQAIEDDTEYERFYHYRKDKGCLVLLVPGNWAPTIAAFKNAKKDVEEAVDCYASEHETACVYHLMRVLEHGLRELAAAVNVTFDVQQWQNVIDQIENQIAWFATKFPSGITKNEWTKFYSEAARHFFFLKDAWRNHAAHNRVTYDETSAKGALEHVRDFMNHLSSRLSESV